MDDEYNKKLSLTKSTRKRKHIEISGKEANIYDCDNKTCQLDFENCSVEKILKTKKELKEKIFFYQKLIDNNKKILKTLDGILANKCDHSWVYFPPEYQYDSSSYVCSNCKLDKREFCFYYDN